MEPLPVGIRQPPGPPRPPAPPITGGGGGDWFFGGRPERLPCRPPRRNFLREVIVEMRKVAWPNRDTVVHNATLCLVVLIGLMAAIASIDLGLAALVRVVTDGG